MKGKIVSVVLMLTLALCLTASLAKADTNCVMGSIGSSDSVIVSGGSVILTCTYTSNMTSSGNGKLLISGPYANPADPHAFNSFSIIHWWDGGTGPDSSPLLTSGVPVTFTQQLDTVGYYKFQWQCQATDGTNGAYVDVLVHVVATPSELPEAPPLAAIAACFIAVGAFAVASKKIKIPI
jgi:hypothetical protein